MVLEAVKTLLKNYPEVDVNKYISYLNRLFSDKDNTGKLKNAWLPFIKPEDFAQAFKQVAKEGLVLDGETITLGFRKAIGLKIEYGYQAYKAKLLQTYPETIIDIQNVYNGDSFHFEKNSGIVSYKHVIGNPFDVKKTIIGCYCVIKNSRGQFLEMLNLTDINKMKNSSNMKNVWEVWESEMILKSVIKRASKRHFYDITKGIDAVDNEDYSPEYAEIDNDIQGQIENATSYDELASIYQKNIANCRDKNAFVLLLNQKRESLKK